MFHVPFADICTANSHKNVQKQSKPKHKTKNSFDTSDGQTGYEFTWIDK